MLLPESVMEEPDELRAWLSKALAYVATLPPKAKRSPRKPVTKAARTKPEEKKADKRTRSVRA